MVMVRATATSEAGGRRDEALARYDEELLKAGVLLVAEGLEPTASGVRVQFSGARRTVVDGPFADSGGPVQAFWLWQVKSMAEAVEWAKRCPNPAGDADAEIEIRQVFDRGV